jgi:hypothetical protein
MQLPALPALASLCKHPELADRYREPLGWAQEALHTKRDLLGLILKIILEQETNFRAFAPVLISAEADQIAYSKAGARVGANPEILREKATAIQQLQQAEAPLRETETALVRWIEAEIYSVIAYASFEESANPSKNSLEEALVRHAVLKGIDPISDDDGGIISIFGGTDINLGVRVPLHIPPMDEYILEGGVPRKSTILLTGPSNVGKSRIGLNSLVHNVIYNEVSVLASGEDSWQMTRARAFASLLGITQNRVMAMSEEERNIALEFKLHLLESQYRQPGLAQHIRTAFNMKRFKNGTLMPSSIQDLLRKTSDSAGKACSIVMIDYLQCGIPNGGPRKNEPTDQQLERFVREIEDVCVEEDAIAIIIAQAKGEQVGKKQASLVNTTARSYAAIQAAQYVLTILQSEEETQRRIETGDHTASLDLVLCKAKDTGLGACYAISSPNTSSYRFFANREERDVVARQESRRSLADGARSSQPFRPPGRESETFHSTPPQ